MATLREGERARFVQKMFARISERYDLLNAVMSLGRDQSWRRLTAKMAAPSPVAFGLDVATGTGDLAVALAERSSRVIALDFCAPMMKVGESKASFERVKDKVAFITGDALKMPFPDNTFDCVTIGFGIRNIDPPLDAFKEMYRVVRQGGRVACLEIMRPSNGLIGGTYKVYMDMIIPSLGRLLSKDGEAYRYLSDSVFNFFRPNELKNVMQEAGLQDVRYVTLHLGALAIHVGEK